MTTSLASRRFTGDLRADTLVAVVVAAALAAGFLYQQSLTSQTSRFTDSHSGFALSIPAHWTVNQETSTDTFLDAYDTRADSLFKSSVTGQSFAIDPDNPAVLDELVDRLIQRHGEALASYHLLDIQEAIVGQAETRAVRYAYVAQPIDDPFMAAPPVVVIATDYVIYTQREYWVLTLAADEKLADQARPAFERIVASVTIPPQ